MKSLDDTICAVATPPGEGGIAIVRVSGPRASEIARGLLRSDKGEPLDLTPRHAHLVQVVSPEDNSKIDEALALWMPGPNSYTKEDILEIQSHGGRAAANGVLDAVIECGARLADPGEFTLRAFLRGRIDLVQAEAVADIIHAETGESLKIHEALLGGSLSQEVGRWQDRLADVLVHLEAFLDFPEEELELADRESLATPVREIAEKMRRKIESYAWGRTASDGFKVAILGLPNVGKSSLLNKIAEEERAIVSPHAGTTRDTIEVKVNAMGAPVSFIDTAGLRTGDDVIEMEGVARARKAGEEADLMLLVFDGSRPLEKSEHDEAEAFAGTGKSLVVINKADLGTVPVDELSTIYPGKPIMVSAKSGDGVEDLLLAIRDKAWCGSGPRGEEPLTRMRHRDNVRDALACVERALDLLDSSDYMDAAAQELQNARRHLSLLLGWGTPEDIVDKIFSDFCIGK